MRCISWKKRLARDCKLYLILDTQVASYNRLYTIAGAAVDAGVDVLQLRDKTGTARQMIEFSRRILATVRGRVPYIINDRVDVAYAVGADGVHVGQDDVPVSVAREVLGPRAIVGVSCQTADHLAQAIRDGADYVGFGSVFETLTKPERRAMNVALLTKVARESTIPLFAIGGITHDRISVVGAHGITRVAVCRAICQVDNVARETKKLKQALKKIQ